MATQIKGIDVSKYQAHSNGQTKVDFEKLKKAGYDFVMLRAGYGKVLWQKDIAFESHYKAAKAAGLHVGAYHYTYAKSVSEAYTEANCFLNWIANKKLDYPVAFDIEDKSIKSLGKNKLTDIALAFMSEVEQAGYYTMLYCNADWAKNYLDMQRLKHFDVWLACYTSEERRKKLYTGEILGMWQNSSSLKLKGVYPAGAILPKNLDSDIAYKDYAAIIKKAGLNHL